MVVDMTPAVPLSYKDIHTWASVTKQENTLLVRVVILCG